MKILILSLLVMFLAGFSYAGDILTLNNQMCFEGKIVKIKGCEVIFKADGEKYSIPCTDIYSIQFESVTDRAYVNYLKALERNPELCAKGYKDAELYHGNGFFHFALGFFFGPLAMIGTAITKADPALGARTNRLSENQEHFYDPEYLRCYRKKVKSGKLAMEALGLSSWIIIWFVAGR